MILACPETVFSWLAATRYTTVLHKNKDQNNDIIIGKILTSD